ncbi:MAG: hypothetical protein AUJ92_01545 [Armatimonadetes bacterium CG2_30_59_28]|nr:hypothetical protein [Armatimonadota bacterium]OIO98369.1 MAG: hypothetical protein AUJ92_01545 [Armatimonadetes bacterium CG2_30_59_28]PIX38955.1 MAG: hypothetical protein COZ56_19060 [Armatimonadetes bacterium CG_4_8_14_3_um_filter_58_9]
MSPTTPQNASTLPGPGAHIAAAARSKPHLPGARSVLESTVLQQVLRRATHAWNEAQQSDQRYDRQLSCDTSGHVGSLGQWMAK